MFVSRVAIALLSVLAVTVSALDSTTVRELETKKLEKLDKLSNGGSKPIVFNDGNYDELAIKDPRPYTLFLLFSASPGMGCHKCPYAEEEFEVLATSYKMMESKPETPIYFGVVHYKDSRKTFDKHKLNSAPMVLYVPPSSETQGLDLYKMEDSRSLKTEATSAEDFAKFVRMKEKYDIEIYRSPIARIALGLGTLLVLVASAKTLVIKVVPLMRKTSRIWMVLSMLVYFISVSGSIFCIIRNAAPYGFDKRTRKPIIFSTDGRNQYLYEGLAIGWLNLATALSAILMVRGPPPSLVRLFNGKQGSKGNSSALYITTIVSFLLFALLYRTIVQLYLTKTPWYLMQSNFARSVVLPFF